jgi:hypothetical protein
MNRKYPEHEKMKAARSESQCQGELLEWLSEEKDFAICYRSKLGEFIPILASTESLLAEFHGIDLNKIAQEKDAMVEEMRAAHGLADT